MPPGLYVLSVIWSSFRIESCFLEQSCCLLPTVPKRVRSFTLPALWDFQRSTALHATSSFLPLLWRPQPCKAWLDIAKTEIAFFCFSSIFFANIAKLQSYTLSSRYATAVLCVKAVTPQTPTSGTICRTFLMRPSPLSALRAWL